MGTEQRDIEVLRNNQLMRRSEFSEMVRALDQHFATTEDLKRLPFGRKRSARTFYCLLLKMLYETALTRTPEKQLEDINRVYLWFHSNKSYWNTTTRFKGAKSAKLKLHVRQQKVSSLQCNSSPLNSTTSQELLRGTDFATSPSQMTHLTRRPKITRGRLQSPETLNETLTVQSALQGSSHASSTKPRTLLTPEVLVTLNKMRRDEAALLSSNSDDDEGFTSFYLKHLKEQSLGNERTLTSVDEDKEMSVGSNNYTQMADAHKQTVYAPATTEQLCYSCGDISGSLVEHTCHVTSISCPSHQIKEHSPVVRQKFQELKLQTFPDKLTLADIEFSRLQKRYNARHSLKAGIVYKMASQIGEQLLEKRMKLSEKSLTHVEGTQVFIDEKDKHLQDGTVPVHATTLQNQLNQVVDASTSFVSEAETSGLGESMVEVTESFPGVFLPDDAMDSATFSAEHSPSPECSSPVSISITLVDGEPIVETTVEDEQHRVPPSTPKAGSVCSEIASSETETKKPDEKPTTGQKKGQTARSNWRSRETGSYRWTADGVGGSTYMKRIVKAHTVPAQQLSPRLHTTPVKPTTRIKPRPVEMTKTKAEMLQSTMKVKHVKLTKREMQQRCGSSRSLSSCTDMDSVKGNDKNYSLSKTKIPHIVVDGDEKSSDVIQRMRPSSAVSSRPSSSRSQLESSLVKSCTSLKSLRAENERYQWVGLDVDLLDTDGITRRREAKAAVDIQRIFREYQVGDKQRKQRDKERKEKAASVLQRNFRGFLARKRQIETNIAVRGKIVDKAWTVEHQKGITQKQADREKGSKKLMQQQARNYHKRMKSINSVKPHWDIYKLFHPDVVPKEIKSKAAVAIQRAWKGYRERKAKKAFTTASLLSGASPRYVVREFYSRVERLRRMHMCEKFTLPNATFIVLQDYTKRRATYEKAFKRLAANGTLEFCILKKFFKECDHFPTTRELNTAVFAVTGATSIEEVKYLTCEQALDAIFYLYLPSGSNFKSSHVRKSTWLNPIVDGKEALAMKEKIAKQTDLKRCLELVAAMRARVKSEG